MDRKISALSIAFGIIMTIITGFFPTFLAQIQIDVAQYGTPLPYASRVIPTHITTYHYPEMLVDVVFWSVLFFITAWVVVHAYPRKS
jgi:hypothetical protein